MVNCVLSWIVDALYPSCSWPSPVTWQENLPLCHVSSAMEIFSSSKWKTTWLMWLKKLKIDVPQDPAITLLGNMPKRLGILLERYFLTHVHCCSIHKSQKLETAQISINWWMHNENVVHLHNGILFTYKEKWNYENFI